MQVCDQNWPRLHSEQGPSRTTTKALNVKSKMMEGIGNFSVKRKRNLDPLDISEIIVASNFYILLKLKKKTKGKMNCPCLLWETFLNMENSREKIKRHKTSRMEICVELKPVAAVRVIGWNLQIILLVDIIWVNFSRAIVTALKSFAGMRNLSRGKIF